MLAVVTLLSAIGFTVSGPANPAHADPACMTNGGVYVLFVRGSGEHFNDQEAYSFYWSVLGAIQAKGYATAWSELGNEDGGVPVDMNHLPTTYGTSAPGPDATDEYPAVKITKWTYLSGGYHNSVWIGVTELIKHLNDRVSRCPYESIVLGGYSQGADVVGSALQLTGYGSLNATTRSHIGYVALYGDPTFDNGPLGDRLNKANFSSDWWWVRGDDPGYRYQYGVNLTPDSGALGPRSPYVPADLSGRFGSWCAAKDGFCTGSFVGSWDIGTHGDAYHPNSNPDVSRPGGWIADSAAEIAYKAESMCKQLSPCQSQQSPSGYTSPDPNSGPVVAAPTSSSPPPLPTILQVKRSLAPDGTTHEVYAATNSTVTEGWWVPGGDGVHNDQIITISQGNIVGFDKVNEPDGVTQSLYTAVPDGVWETWWRPGDGPHSSKIVSGLSGVRQVIVANAYESGQFVHRLYLLAQDGPYEVWWKDGGDGVHWDRLNNITGGVAMAAGTGPDGAYEVFVATPTWVYELWWFPGNTVNYRTILNVTQGDIRSLSMGVNLSDGTQLLYTGTSTTGWQSAWVGDSGGVSTGAISVGQTNAGEVEKDVYNGVHELYQTDGGRVQENWWNNSGSGSDTLITISQNNITSFDKSDDGNYQQVYTASGDLVYETYWAAGVNPTTDVLYSVPQ
jgi:hypothetical protein